MTVMWFAIDLALFFNSYVNPIALDGIKWKYYIVYDCWLAFELYIVWQFYIETKNTPLEEIVRHFDGESAVLGGAIANEKSRQLAEQMDMHAVGGNEDGLHGTNHADEKTVADVRQEESPATKLN